MTAPLLEQVVIVGVGLKRSMTREIEPFTWLYFPDRRVPFYRVTMLSKYGEVSELENREKTICPGDSRWREVLVTPV